MGDKLKGNFKGFLISLIVYTSVFTLIDTSSYFSGRIDPSIAFIPVFSLIWGPWGIAGVMFGDLIGRFALMYLFGSFSILEIIVFSIIVLFISIFIYKLFFTFVFNKKSVQASLSDVYGLIKFVGIILIANVFYVYIHIYYDLVYTRVHFQGTILKEFLNNYFAITNISLIFSLLLISIFALLNVGVYKPKKNSFYQIPCKFIDLLMILCVIISICITIIFSEFHSVLLKSYFFSVICLIILSVLKPITNEYSCSKNNLSFDKLVVFIFLLFSIILTLFLVLDDILSVMNNKYLVNEIISIFLGYGTFVYIISSFIITMVLMFYLEVHFTEPLRSILGVIEKYTLNRADEETFESKERFNKSLKEILKELEVLSNYEYDIGSLSSSFKEMINNLEIYMTKLKRVTIEKQKINTELSIASRIQGDLIPNSFPSHRYEFGIYATYDSAKEVGGDFYDYLLVDDDHVAIIIGDVSGKGVSAALFMSMIVTLIRDGILFGLNPSEVFSNVNERIIDNSNNFMFVTAWLGILELTSGKLTYVNAGHEHPYLSRNYSDYLVLAEESSLVLGLKTNINYIQNEIKMYEGDRLYLYSDGITEAFNKNYEQFKKDRLLELLNKNKHLKIKQLILEIKRELNNFTSGAEQFDDETMLILEYKKKKKKILI